MFLLCMVQETVLYMAEELGSLFQMEFLMLLLLKRDMVGNQWVLQ